MSHYMVRWQFTDISRLKALVEKPQDRTGASRALIEGFGGKLLSYYFSFGEYDGFSMSEFPDNTAVAACSMAATATGALHRFETTMLSAATEAEAAMSAHTTLRLDINRPACLALKTYP